MYRQPSTDQPSRVLPALAVSARFCLFILVLLTSTLALPVLAQETIDIPGACTDGLDNDGDGAVDRFDSSCNPLADPSFEAYTSCPNAGSQFGSLLPDWDLVAGTAELFVYSDGACDFRPDTLWGPHLSASQPTAPADGVGFGGFHNGNPGLLQQEVIIQNLATPLPAGNTYQFTLSATKLPDAGPNATVLYDMAGDRPIRVFGIRTGTAAAGVNYSACDISSTSADVDDLGTTDVVNQVGTWQEISFSFTASESYDRLVFSVECDTTGAGNTYTYLLIDNLRFGLAGGPPNLQVSIDNGATELSPGDSVVYTVVVENTGSGDANAVILEQMLPPGMSIATPGVTCTPNGLATCGSIVTGAAGATSVEVTGSQLPADASGNTFLTFAIPVVLSNVVADFGSPLPATLNATIEVSDSDEPATVEVQADNSASDVDNLAVAVTSPNLQVSIDNGVDELSPGDSVDYTVVVENTGSGDATAVVLEQILPMGMSIAAPGVTCTANGLATCGSIVTGAAGATSVEVTGSQLPADASGNTFLTFTIPVALSGVEADFGSPLPATLDATIEVSDSATNANNSASDVDNLVVAVIEPVAIPTLSGLFMVMLSAILAVLGVNVLRRH